ncbi:hypothetical protein BBJ28_00002617 [Nothophytophthora sp. Chile5]|nr:hypothetical protein BBJ28_00002617 [Nothophytophthora sp. Chile5]
MVACSNSKKAHDRELWQRRVIRAEMCIFSADSAMKRRVPCSHEWKLRLFKAKFLLQQQAKIERTVRNRRMLELLCHALQCCAEAAGDSDEALVANYRQYFGVKLKACLVKMHASTVMAKNARANSGITSFMDNLTYVRSALPNYVDKSFLVLEEIKTLTQDAGGNSDQKVGGMLKEAYLDNILDALRVNVMACSDPAQALTLAMGAIHAVQTSLQTYAPYPAVRLMLIAILFDMLHVYCRLLGLQCRYSEMGASIVQMTTLFATYKSFLEPTIFYRFFLARCHTLIAKHVALEALRPTMFSLLHASLQRLDASVNCCETTSEIMALLGPQLIAYGKGEHGEETLTNAVRTALHSKDVLLQVRLLADIFELYNTKKLVEARATAAAKYEKKLALLRRRVAAAQAEEATTAALLRWTTGSDGGSEARAKVSTPSRG